MSVDGQHQEELDEYEERQLRQTGGQVAQQEDTSFERDVLEFLAKTDVSDQGRAVFKDYLSRDFVFANLDYADYNEMKWELRVLKEALRLLFPPQECLVVGDDRAAINDDPSDQAVPMTQEDRARMESLFRIARLRLTRSKDMKQQEVLRTSIAQTEVRRGERESNGGIRGKIRSWRS